MAEAEHAVSLTTGEDARPLPSCWSSTDHDPALILQSSGLEIRHQSCLSPSPGSGTRHTSVAVRADRPIPSPQSIGGDRLYYFEVTLISVHSRVKVAIGLSGATVRLDTLPGFEPYSYGYHNDNGRFYMSRTVGNDYGQLFGTGDVIGCGIYGGRHGGERILFFTKNGVDLGNAWRAVRDVELWPTVGMVSPGAQVKVNFGEEAWMFDVAGKRRELGYPEQES